MAEVTDSSNEPDIEATSLTRRERAHRAPEPRPAPAKVARQSRSAAAVSVTAPPRGPRQKTRSKPLRNAVILTMVAGLIATVALPAYAATTRPSDAQTLQQVSKSDAQSLVVASDATATSLTRDSYAATTAAEIAQKKAEAAAAAAAVARAAAAAAAASASVSTSIPLNVSMTSPGSGLVRWPLLNFTKGRGLWDSGYHQGVDLLAPAMTPIYAAAAGVVSVSSESHYGYGVAIEIQHVIGGQQVTTLYGHMTYGTRQVQAGDTVAAGQLIGFVGSTGSSTANHCHFEVHINGSVVDPWQWLIVNAGPLQ